jgi:hypothetical protein
VAFASNSAASQRLAPWLPALSVHIGTPSRRAGRLLISSAICVSPPAGSRSRCGRRAAAARPRP